MTSLFVIGCEGTGLTYENMDARDWKINFIGSDVNIGIENLEFKRELGSMKTTHRTWIWGINLPSKSEWCDCDE